jgi:hypothetical protein
MIRSNLLRSIGDNWGARKATTAAKEEVCDVVDCPNPRSKADRTGPPLGRLWRCQGCHEEHEAAVAAAKKEAAAAKKEALKQRSALDGRPELWRLSNTEVRL